MLWINEAAVPTNTKIETKLGLTVFNGELFNLSKLKMLSYNTLKLVYMKCRALRKYKK